MLKKISLLLFVVGATLLGNAQSASPFKFTVVKNLEATEVKSQGSTGTCWCFSASSFVESEIIRKTSKKIDEPGHDPQQ